MSAARSHCRRGQLTFSVPSARLEWVLARVCLHALVGPQGAIAEAELETTQGLPRTDSVNLSGKAMQESRLLAQATQKNAMMLYPCDRTLVGPATASLRCKDRRTIYRSP